MATSSELPPKFQALLSTILSTFPENAEGQQVAGQIRQVLASHFQSPKSEQLGLLLREHFTDERYRELLFFPTSDDIAHYVACIHDPPSGAPSDHPQAVIQPPFLAMLYLHHIKQTSFATEFVKQGGITVLACMVNHENLYVRGQIVECLLLITGSEHFDWFLEDEKTKTRKQALYHPKMLELTQTPFVKHLLANLVESFPGGSFLCLQLLGFWLSWLRFFYSENQVLRVSADIIAALEAHTRKSGLVSDELQLATKLYEDFSRFPMESSGLPGKSSSSQAGVSVDQAGVSVDQAGVSVDQADARPAIQLNTSANQLNTSANQLNTSANQPDASANQPCTNPTPPDNNNPETREIEVASESLETTPSADELKAEGNELLKRNNFQEAVKKYSAAIALDDSNAVFYANRAAARLALASSGSVKSKVDTLNECVSDCRAALELQPRYHKVSYRLIRALHDLGRSDEAIQLAKDTLDLYEDEEEDGAAELDAIRKLLAAIHETHREQFFQDDEAEILQALLKRASIKPREVVADPTLEQKPPPEPPANAKASTDEHDLWALDGDSDGGGDQFLRDTVVDVGAILGEIAPPERAMDIEKKLKEFSPDPVQFGEYMLLLGDDPGRYKRVFKESFTEEICVALLVSVDAFLPRRVPDALALLNGMTGVNRFGTILMFLSSQDRQRIKAIFQILSAVGPTTSELQNRVEQLKVLYGVKA